MCSSDLRKKDCNITPFVQSSPRLNDQTSSGNRTKVLQRSWTTERETDVQMDSHQRRAKEYRKDYRFGGDRIDHDVPSYNRNRIGIEDKRRKDVLARICGNGGKCMMGSPLDSGREDGIKSTQLKDQQGQGRGCQAEEGLKWVKRGHECHWGVRCARQHPKEWGRHGPLCPCDHHLKWKSLLQ